MSDVRLRRSKHVAGAEHIETVRIDRWLSAARIFKSRTQASAACLDGDVRINGVRAKASHLVKVGDQVRAQGPRGRLVMEVKSLSDRRLPPALARELYVERSGMSASDEPVVATFDAGGLRVWEGTPVPGENPKGGMAGAGQLTRQREQEGPVGAPVSSPASHVPTRAPVVVEIFPLREPGAGRPTKVERRAVERLRGR